MGNEGAKIVVTPALYYIQHKGYCGNCLFWWKPDGSGYTCNLDEAWKVTLEKAKEICRDRPSYDKHRAVTMVDAWAVRHVMDQEGDFQW